MTAHDWVDGWCRGCGQHEGTMNLTSECDLTVAQVRQALTYSNTQTRRPVTRPPLELARELDDMATVLQDPEMHATLTAASAALRAQAEAGAGEAELLAELREALVAFDAASAEEDAAMVALMGASQNAPKNERGQFLDPGAVHRAAEPFRPRHQAAQDARMEAQDIIDGLALESARLAVKLAGGLPALAQADAGGEA